MNIPKPKSILPYVIITAILVTVVPDLIGLVIRELYLAMRLL